MRQKGIAAKMTDLTFPFMTRAVFDTLILVVVILGLGLAVVRLYRDFTRPLPPPRPPLYRPAESENGTMSDGEAPTQHPESKQNT